MSILTSYNQQTKKEQVNMDIEYEEIETCRGCGYFDFTDSFNIGICVNKQSIHFMHIRKFGDLYCDKFDGKG
jgi:hypothetical protein